jgi:decaprenyl-phosphate phosphoribosyltransferase
MSADAPERTLNSLASPFARRDRDSQSETPFSAARPTVLRLVKIARVDHWVKNVFVLPGIVAAMGFEPWTAASLIPKTLVGLLSVCLVASSNYTINEVLDAPFDRFHPIKRRRPVPVGEVSLPLAYVQWVVLMVVGVAVGLTISLPFSITMFFLWCMGCVYNIEPLRSKDKPYLDVLSEAIDNPIRMLAGWFIVGSTVVPSASLLLSYWMAGCYFMAIKRFAELRDLGSSQQAARYRRSFAFYSTDGLLVSIIFYGASAMLFFGAFCMRYRGALVLAYPLIALVMAAYLRIGLKPQSAAQAPEKLYREPFLMAAVVCCAVVMGALLFVDVPAVHYMFPPTMGRTLAGGNCEQREETCSREALVPSGIAPAGDSPGPTRTRVAQVSIPAGPAAPPKAR